MGEKEQIKLKDMTGVQFLNTYWDAETGDIRPRKMQIGHMTVTCRNCAQVFEMSVKDKGVDILHNTEIWIGTCTHCFVTNALTIKVVKEEHRVPSDGVIAMRKARAEGKELKHAGWVKDDRDAKDTQKD